MNTFTTFIAFSAVVCVTFANPPVSVNKGYNKDTIKVIKAPTLPAAVDAWPTKVSSQQIGPNIQLNGGIQQAGWNGQWAGALPINAGLVNPIAVGEPYPCPLTGNGYNGIGLTGLSAGWGAPALGNSGCVVEQLAPRILSVAAPAPAPVPVPAPAPAPCPVLIKSWAASNLIAKAKY